MKGNRLKIYGNSPQNGKKTIKTDRKTRFFTLNFGLSVHK